MSHDSIELLDEKRYMHQGPFPRWRTGIGETAAPPATSAVRGTPTPHFHRSSLSHTRVLYVISLEAVLCGIVTQSGSWFLFHGALCTNVSCFSICKGLCRFKGPPSKSAALPGVQRPQCGGEAGIPESATGPERNCQEHLLPSPSPGAVCLQSLLPVWERGEKGWDPGNSTRCG